MLNVLESSVEEGVDDMNANEVTSVYFCTYSSLEYLLRNTKPVYVPLCMSCLGLLGEVTMYTTPYVCLWRY